MPVQDQYGTTLLVRIPRDIKDNLAKIKRKENLPTLGSALKFWIEQATNEQVETRLVGIEEKLNEILNEIRTIEDRLVRTDEKATVTAAYFAVELEQLHGEGAARSYLDRLEKITEMDIHELLEERKTRQLSLPSKGNRRKRGKE